MFGHVQSTRIRGLVILLMRKSSELNTLWGRLPHCPDGISVYDLYSALGFEDAGYSAAGLGFVSLGPFHCARFIFVLCITVCCMHDCLGL